MSQSKNIFTLPEESATLHNFVSSSSLVLIPYNIEVKLDNSNNQAQTWLCISLMKSFTFIVPVVTSYKLNDNSIPGHNLPFLLWSNLAKISSRAFLFARSSRFFFIAMNAILALTIISFSLLSDGILHSTNKIQNDFR